MSRRAWLRDQKAAEAEAKQPVAAEYDVLVAQAATVSEVTLPIARQID